MATSNFYQDGNHGLNVIVTLDNGEEDEFIVEDTLANIVSELSSKGYSVDDASYLTQAPRSFETGQGFTVYNKNGKMVAYYELCAGYYSGANVNIYTGDDLTDILDDEDITKNKRDIDRVVKCVEAYTSGYKRVATFSNGETIYEEGK